MKRRYLVSLVGFLGGILVVGFSLGYCLHLSTALQRFAQETDRSPSDYAWSLAWVHPADGGRTRPVLLAQPKGDKQAPWEAQTRWRWQVANPAEPCDPDQHRLVWRVGADRWELVEDLEGDRSVPPFPDEEAP